jgi:hypothetical protein
MRSLDHEIADRLKNRGLLELHPEQQFNLQLNRFLPTDSVAADVRDAATRIHDFDDFKREMVALAKKSEQAGDGYAAFCYYEASRFYLGPEQAAERAELTEKMIDSWVVGWSRYGVERTTVPYGDFNLRVHHFPVDKPRDVVVMFGGYDSYIEEFTPYAVALQENGYEVIVFEGPGQGAGIEAGSVMTTQWHKPVGAVLDAFKVTECTLVGLSMGGCLVIRASAFEPRVKRTIALDILTDMLDVTVRTKELAAQVREPSGQGARDVAQHFEALAEGNPTAAFMILQGRRVTGSTSTAEYLQKISEYVTADVSSQVTSDVLLMAGQDDTYVPYEQFFEQVQTLTNARSISTRTFTKHENNAASGHLNCGNGVAAVTVILDWLDQTLLLNPDV